MAEQWLEGVNPKTIKGEKMKTRITLWIVIGVLFVITAILTFKAGAAGSTSLAQTAVSAVSSSGMVGGC